MRDDDKEKAKALIIEKISESKKRLEQIAVVLTAKKSDGSPVFSKDELSTAITKCEKTIQGYEEEAKCYEDSDSEMKQAAVACQMLLRVVDALRQQVKGSSSSASDDFDTGMQKITNSIKEISEKYKEFRTEKNLDARRQGAELIKLINQVQKDIKNLENTNIENTTHKLLRSTRQIGLHGLLAFLDEREKAIKKDMKLLSEAKGSSSSEPSSTSRAIQGAAAVGSSSSSSAAAAAASAAAGSSSSSAGSIQTFNQLISKLGGDLKNREEAIKFLESESNFKEIIKNEKQLLELLRCNALKEETTFLNANKSHIQNMIKDHITLIAFLEPGITDAQRMIFLNSVEKTLGGMLENEIQLLSLFNCVKLNEDHRTKILDFVKNDIQRIITKFYALRDLLSCQTLTHQHRAIICSCFNKSLGKMITRSDQLADLLKLPLTEEQLKIFLDDIGEMKIFKFLSDTTKKSESDSILEKFNLKFDKSNKSDVEFLENYIKFFSNVKSPIYTLCENGFTYPKDRAYFLAVVKKNKNPEKLVKIFLYIKSKKSEIDSLEKSINKSINLIALAYVLLLIETKGFQIEDSDFSCLITALKSASLNSEGAELIKKKKNDLAEGYIKEVSNKIPIGFDRLLGMLNDWRLEEVSRDNILKVVYDNLGRIISNEKNLNDLFNCKYLKEDQRIEILNKIIAEQPPVNEDVRKAAVLKLKAAQIQKPSASIGSSSSESSSSASRATQDAAAVGSSSSSSSSSASASAAAAGGSFSSMRDDSVEKMKKSVEDIAENLEEIDVAVKAVLQTKDPDEQSELDEEIKTLEQDIKKRRSDACNFPQKDRTIIEGFCDTFVERLSKIKKEMELLSSVSEAKGASSLEPSSTSHTTQSVAAGSLSSSSSAASASAAAAASGSSSSSMRNDFGKTMENEIDTVAPALNLSHSTETATSTPNESQTAPETSSASPSAAKPESGAGTAEIDAKFTVLTKNPDEERKFTLEAVIEDCSASAASNYNESDDTVRRAVGEKNNLIEKAITLKQITVFNDDRLETQQPSTSIGSSSSEASASHTTQSASAGGRTGGFHSSSAVASASAAAAGGPSLPMRDDIVRTVKKNNLIKKEIMLERTTVFNDYRFDIPKLSIEETQELKSVVIAAIRDLDNSIAGKSYDWRYMRGYNDTDHAHGLLERSNLVTLQNALDQTDKKPIEIRLPVPSYSRSFEKNKAQIVLILKKSLSQEAVYVKASASDENKAFESDKNIVRAFLKQHGNSSVWKNKTADNTTLQEIVDYAKELDDKPRGFFSKPKGTATRTALKDLGLKKWQRGEIKIENIRTDCGQFIADNQQKFRR